MFSFIKKTFKYIEPAWTGDDGKFSLRSSLAIIFSINLMRNLTHAIYKWDAGRSLEGLALVLGIEAGLIAGLLALKVYQNTINRPRFTEPHDEGVIEEVKDIVS